MPCKMDTNRWNYLLITFLSKSGCKGDTHGNSSHPTPNVRKTLGPGAAARESEVGSQIERQKISSGEKEQVGI